MPPAWRCNPPFSQLDHSETLVIRRGLQVWLCCEWWWLTIGKEFYSLSPFWIIIWCARAAKFLFLVLGKNGVTSASSSSSVLRYIIIAWVQSCLVSCGAAAGVDHLGRLVSSDSHQPLMSGALDWTRLVSGVPRSSRTLIEGARKPWRAELGGVAPLFRPHLVLKGREILRTACLVFTIATWRFLRTASGPPALKGSWWPGAAAFPLLPGALPLVLPVPQSL